MKQRVLITGAGGFLGARVARQLVEQGRDVALVLRETTDTWRINDLLPRCTVIKGDLRAVEALRCPMREFAPQAVLHLAWEGIKGGDRNSPAHFHNVQSALQLYELAHALGVRQFLGLGSQAEYGPAQGRISEADAPKPTNMYGAAKLATAVFLERAAAAQGVAFSWLRLFSSYGPGDDPAWLLPYLVDSLLDGKRPALTAAEQVWDYLHIDDAASGVVAALDAESRGIFNLGSGVAVQLRSIIELIRDTIDPGLPLGFGEVPYRGDQVMHLEADIRALTAASGWQPRIDLHQGLRGLVEAHRAARTRMTSAIAARPETVQLPGCAGVDMTTSTTTTDTPDQSTQCTVSQYIVRFLHRKDIGCVFELSGGMIMDLIDALHVDGRVDIVNVHHEQAAAFAADAVGRLSGKPGVALATSGPGATNLLTGIGSCYFDSSPALFITGQVKSNEQKGARNIRQLGFQETDIVSMAKPVTKLAMRVRLAADVPRLLEEAYALTMSGRPGPVLLDIPMEMFRETITSPMFGPVPAAPSTESAVDKAQVAKLFTALRKAERPLILVGGGVRAGNCTQAFRDFIERTQIPVVWSLLACDVLPGAHANAVGMIGTYGNRWANLAVSQSDLLLVLGSRLDIRQTGANTVSFKRGRDIFQVDVEAEEINNRVIGCEPVVADMRDFLREAEAALNSSPLPPFASWRERIASLKEQWPDTAELAGAKGINPNKFMHALSRKQQAAVFAVDVGQHQMWAAQSLEIAGHQRFLTSGGMGAMGFALPAGLGAAFYLRGQHPVVVIAGDAGFQLSLQEMQTIVRNKLPVKIVIMNNRCHGMTRQFQETYFKGRYQGTVWGYDAPDFERVAAAYGIASATLHAEADTEAAVQALWAQPLQPYLLQVSIDTHTNVYPKLAFGKEISDMEPFAAPIEMEGT